MGLVVHSNLEAQVLSEVPAGTTTQEIFDRVLPYGLFDNLGMAEVRTSSLGGNDVIVARHIAHLLSGLATPHSVQALVAYIRTVDEVITDKRDWSLPAPVEQLMAQKYGITQCTASQVDWERQPALSNTDRRAYKRLARQALVAIAHPSSRQIIDVASDLEVFECVGIFAHRMLASSTTGGQQYVYETLANSLPILAERIAAGIASPSQRTDTTWQQTINFYQKPKP